MWEDLLGRVDAKRLQQATLDLVRIRSYTGDTREVAAAYARHLEGIGLAVEVLRDFPNDPCVVARLRGAGAGPTLEFNGHLDTVPVDHPAPYVKDGRIYGRGSADMKGGLAAMAEAAHVIVESGVRLKGDLLLVAHGLHEAPDGHGEDLSDLVRRGINGDAVIITELASDTLPVVGLGQAAFDFTITRPGESSHELLTPPDTPHPILAAVRLVNLMQARHNETRARQHPLRRPRIVLRRHPAGRRLLQSVDQHLPTGRDAALRTREFIRQRSGRAPGYGHAGRAGDRSAGDVEPDSRARRVPRGGGRAAGRGLAPCAHRR